MFYLLIIPATLFLLYNWYRLNQIKTHDQVLYRFCQLRRDIILTIDNDFESYSKNEYKEIRLLLDQLNMTIHHFNEVKKHIFTFKIYNQFIDQYFKLAVVKKQKKGITSKNEAICLLYKQYSMSLYKGFVTYVPLFKYRTIIKISYLMIKLLASIGLEEVVKEKEKFLKHLMYRQPEMIYS